MAKARFLERFEELILQHSSDPIGTEDLFAKWNRALQR